MRCFLQFDIRYNIDWGIVAEIITNYCGKKSLLTVYTFNLNKALVIDICRIIIRVWIICEANISEQKTSWNGWVCATNHACYTVANSVCGSSSSWNSWLSRPYHPMCVWLSEAVLGVLCCHITWWQRVKRSVLPTRGGMIDGQPMGRQLAGICLKHYQQLFTRCDSCCRLRWLADNTVIHYSTSLVR